MSTPTPREVAHAATGCSGRGEYLRLDEQGFEDREHNYFCDETTAAIEAYAAARDTTRDAAWAARLLVAREALGNIGQTREVDARGTICFRCNLSIASCDRSGCAGAVARRALAALTDTEPATPESSRG